MLNSRTVDDIEPNFKTGFHCYLVSNGVEYERARDIEEPLTEEQAETLCSILNIFKL